MVFPAEVPLIDSLTLSYSSFTFVRHTFGLKDSKRCFADYASGPIQFYEISRKILQKSNCFQGLLALRHPSCFLPVAGR